MPNIKQQERRVKTAARERAADTSTATERTLMSSPHEDNRPPDAGESHALTEGDLLPGGNLDKIRTILFGAQSRDYDKRFARLEERVTKETSDIRDEMRRRFDALESLLRREFEVFGDKLRAEENERNVSMKDVSGQLKDATRAISDRLKAEQSERSDSLTELSGELRSASSAIERRIAQVEEKMAKANRELRDQMAEQGRSQSDDLRAKADEIWAALGKAAHELRTEKTDRSALSAMFTELAMRLNDEFKLPADE